MAEAIRRVMVARGVRVSDRVGSSGGVYAGLTGVAAPAGLVEVWSVLSGVDVVGVRFEPERSAGRACAARAGEAQASGPGVPYEELDGSSDNAVRLVWWDRRWAPVVMTADNAIAVDEAPGALGVVGQVIYCDFEVYSDREAVWPSVVEFLRDVLWVVESPGLRVEDGFGSAVHDSGREWPLLSVIVGVGRARRDGVAVPFSGLRPQGV